MLNDRKVVIEFKFETQIMDNNALRQLIKIRVFDIAWLHADLIQVKSKFDDLEVVNLYVKSKLHGRHIWSQDPWFQGWNYP